MCMNIKTKIQLNICYFLHFQLELERILLQVHTLQDHISNIYFRHGNLKQIQKNVMLLFQAS